MLVQTINVAARRRPAERKRVALAVLAVSVLLMSNPETALSQQALRSGATHSGTISQPGEIDEWTLEASKDDYISLSIGEVIPGEVDPGFSPRIRLIGPDGEVLESDQAALSAQVNEVAPLTGTYSVQVSDSDVNRPGTATGDYLLHLAKMPGEFTVPQGDEGGLMTSGFNHSGMIGHVGDLDLWSFEAAQNDYISISIGEVISGEVDPGFNPYIRLFGPDGDLISGNHAQINEVAPLSGTYTVLVADSNINRPGSATGEYLLHLARMQGEFVVPDADEGGVMINGITHVGAVGHTGDLDLWSFEAVRGDTISVSVQEVIEGEVDPGFSPYLRWFGPDGSLIRSRSGTSEAEISGTAELSGMYTVLLADSNINRPGSAVGMYQVRLRKLAPDLYVPEEPRIVNELTTANIEIHSHNPDDFNKPLEFELLSGPDGVALSNVGDTNVFVSWTPLESQGPGEYEVVARVTDIVEGVTWRDTNRFTIRVNEVNQAPALAAVPAQTGTELSSLTFSVSAIDPDLPANNVRFELLDPPDGMTIDSEAGTISWTPSELQGPGEHSVQVRVTDHNPDATNARELSGTGTVTVAVREENRPPVLAVPGDQTIDENNPWTVNVSASDPDLPANPMTVSLIDPPPGMALDPASGVIAWTPTEQQGPGIFTVTVRLADSSPEAANEPQLTDTKTFKVTVREVNAPPLITEIGEQSARPGSAFTFKVAANDPDSPSDAISYRLESAPEGMIIDETMVRSPGRPRSMT